MAWVVAFMSIVSIGSIWLLMSTKQEIKRITKEVQAIGETNSNRVLTLNSSSKVLRDLVVYLNAHAKAGRDKEIYYEQKDKALRQAIANISHDLRTPLTSVLGYLQLMNNIF
ncbi:MAG: histidine kinase dimerization/phospho-acceptor domain-containing protein [Niameybacter sp.]|uniref:histidine kinase dimerization/phospho-acceptor domain-containing protein n=1 Tax=Niameybacter sp. TaxID=2033640 RepID=UPI002FCBC5E9